jgi:hypothetical protein
MTTQTHQPDPAPATAPFPVYSNSVCTLSGSAPVCYRKRGLLPRRRKSFDTSKPMLKHLGGSRPDHPSAVGKLGYPFSAIAPSSATAK